MSEETPEARAARRRRRLTFDAVPDLYEATRRGYPDELLDEIARTGQVGPGSAVLEIGCGTGQLTRQLVPRGYVVTSLDISPGMVAAARTIVDGDRVRFEVCGFEDFDAAGATFNLIVSATAFHWIDPDVAFVKTAALLRPGGWLAVLGTGEVYDDPFGSSLQALWMGLREPAAQSAGARTPSLDEAAIASGHFELPMTREHERRLTLSPDAVAGVERTRATVLDYPPDVRARYDRGLDDLLRDVDEIPLTQRTWLVMARRLDDDRSPSSQPPEAG